MKITISIAVDSAVRAELERDEAGLVNDLVDTIIARSMNEGWDDPAITTETDIKHGANEQ